MNQIPNMQVRRYNEVERSKCSINLCRYLVIIFSVLLGGFAIWLTIFLVNRSSAQKPPIVSIVNDSAFQTYINAPKLLPAWSHTNLSKLNTQPAYLDLLSNISSRKIINSFVKKHNFTELLVFLGSVQYDNVSWQNGLIPFQNEIASFSNDFAVKMGGLIYVNDENLNGLELLKYFNKGIIQYNYFNRKIERVILQIVPKDEAGCLKALEAVIYAQESALVPIYLTVNDVCMNTVFNVSLLIYSNLRITQIINNQPERGFAEILAKISQNACLMLNTSNTYTHMAALTKIKPLFKNIILLYPADTRQFTNGEEALNRFQELINDASNANITFGPFNYLDFYKIMYGMEPYTSAEGYMIDLYAVR
ncbi:Conserved_hypothetical protein [Hexamita inflata]|uniref:Uncharacterized protein n=1 Tax=Hexamita inflata TaxID=28002 RepID=A0ABP1GZH8_9EUKA